MKNSIPPERSVTKKDEMNFRVVAKTVVKSPCMYEYVCINNKRYNFIVISCVNMRGSSGIEIFISRYKYRYTVHWCRYASTVYTVYNMLFIHAVWSPKNAVQGLPQLNFDLYRYASTVLCIANYTTLLRIIYFTIYASWRDFAINGVETSKGFDIQKRILYGLSCTPTTDACKYLVTQRTLERKFNGNSRTKWRLIVVVS